MEGRFDSPNPAAKLYAIERAAREGDRSVIPRIIEQLDSDDPAVRMVAIEALHRLTGTTNGYEHHAPRAERQIAIRRWVEQYRGDYGQSDPREPEPVPVPPLAENTERGTNG